MSTPTSPTTKYIFVTKRAILEDYESLLTDLRVLCNDTEDLSEEYVALWRKHQSDPGLNQVFVNVRLYDADETWTEIASRLYDLETRLKKEARVVSKLPEGTMDDEVGENLVKSFNKLIDEYNAGLRDLKIRGRNMVKLRMGLPSPRSSPEPESEPEYDSSDTETEGNSNLLPLIKMSEEEVEAIRVRLPFHPTPRLLERPAKARRRRQLQHRNQKNSHHAQGAAQAQENPRQDASWIVVPG